MILFAFFCKISKTLEQISGYGEAILASSFHLCNIWRYLDGSSIAGELLIS